MSEAWALVALGLTAGALSGLIGIGGGVVIVPALVFLFGFSQHRAEGTTLALMIPPIGLLAAMPYYQQGHVDVRAGAWICAGFLFGGWLGGHMATNLSNLWLQRVFATALLLIAARMFVAR